MFTRSRGLAILLLLALVMSCPAAFADPPKGQIHGGVGAEAGDAPVCWKWYDSGTTTKLPLFDESFCQANGKIAIIKECEPPCHWICTDVNAASHMVMQAQSQMVNVSGTALALGETEGCCHPICEVLDGPADCPGPRPQANGDGESNVAGTLVVLPLTPGPGPDPLTLVKVALTVTSKGSGIAGPDGTWGASCIETANIAGLIWDVYAVTSYGGSDKPELFVYWKDDGGEHKVVIPEGSSYTIKAKGYFAPGTRLPYNMTSWTDFGATAGCQEYARAEATSSTSMAADGVKIEQ